MKIRVRTVVILALLLLSLVVIVQNTELVPVRILFWDLVMSRSILLGSSIAVGVIIGFLLGRPWRRQKKYVRIKQAGEESQTPPSTR